MVRARISSNAQVNSLAGHRWPTRLPSFRTYARDLEGVTPPGDAALEGAGVQHLAAAVAQDVAGLGDVQLRLLVRDGLRRGGQRLGEVHAGAVGVARDVPDLRA